MSDVTIRLAGPDDGDALAAMIDAMDLYYGDPERSVGDTRSAVEAWLRGEVNDTRFLLAFAGDGPVGLVAFAVLRPGNALSGLLFLKDVFVAADSRGHGVGARLLGFLARFCRDQGIGRIDWVVETAEAERFYERLGAAALPHKRFMRLDGAALADLAED